MPRHAMFELGEVEAMSFKSRCITRLTVQSTPVVLMFLLWWVHVSVSLDPPNSWF